MECNNIKTGLVFTAKNWYPPRVQMHAKASGLPLAFLF